MQTMIFVITGPSGGGKSTLLRRVLEDFPDVQFSVSHTTREKRNSEVEGKDYYFVTRKEFERMIAEKKFWEWAVVHGHYYGTSKREIERKGTKGDIILDVDVQGALQIKSKFKKAITIFILPPRFEELERRLEKRGQNNQREIRRRLEEAKKEIRFYPQFDYLVVNDDFEQAVKELAAIILSTRCRLEARKKNIMPILQSFIDQ